MGGDASLFRGWMFKSILMCLFQMQDLKVFCNYYGFFNILLPKALYGIYRSFVWLNIGLRVFGRTLFNMSVTYLVGGACECSKRLDG